MSLDIGAVGIDYPKELEELSNAMMSAGSSEAQHKAWLELEAAEARYEAKHGPWSINLGSGTLYDLLDWYGLPQWDEETDPHYCGEIDCQLFIDRVSSMPLVTTDYRPPAFWMLLVIRIKKLAKKALKVGTTKLTWA